ncbi:MAG: hypothetical protein GF400_02945 [Candidatus Eisenbacteria bacterium]|nr:hypothetical protein [Candidatus Eisenbacteria bacterium]
MPPRSRELAGFGPFPVYAGSWEVSRDSVRGYALPNSASLMLNGWIFDR